MIILQNVNVYFFHSTYTLYYIIMCMYGCMIIVIQLGNYNLHGVIIIHYMCLYCKTYDQCLCNGIILGVYSSST